MSVVVNPSLLLQRAEKLSAVRDLFKTWDIVEVDPPILSVSAPVIDAHIEPMRLSEQDGRLFLHTSPELSLKKLILETGLDMYALGHVFRSEEEGPLHRSEFTMVEWYRCSIEERMFLEEVHAFLLLFLPPLPYEVLYYEELLNKHLIPSPQACFLQAQEQYPDWDPSCIRDYLFSHHVQPHLGHDSIAVVTHFPEEDASLAQTSWYRGIQVAHRYEFYYRGMELGNAFHELSCPNEHVKRFTLNNKKREAMGKPSLPIDEEFIAALRKYSFPEPTYGIAVGFDRLLMIATNKSSIREVTLAH